MGGEAKHFLLTPVVKLIGTKWTLVYFSSGSLALSIGKVPTSVSLRIGEVKYFSGNKFKVGLLTLDKKERKNSSLNFVNDFHVFCICQTSKE